MKRSILIIGLLLSWAAHAGPSAEKIFAAARGYTAYIETRIETPFIEDEQGSSLGAAFVIDSKRRWLLTNAHVSGRSPAHITAMFAGSVPVKATPVYIDPYLDLAILEYEADEIAKPHAAKLECEFVPGTGHPVGAFGHPNGFKFSGTRGVISGRTYRFGADWLQTDAPINGGNSGGPLISLETGRVVGINTATLNDKESQNANFAVLAAQACRVINLLKRGADPRPASLGVSFFREGDEDSLRVAKVFSVGAAAGLRHGDIILGLAGVKEIPTSEGQLIHLLRGRSEHVRLDIRRSGQMMTLDTSFPPRVAPLERRGLNVGGALLALSNQTDIEGLVSASAVMVHAVTKGSPAEIARLKPYDHLVSIDGVAVNNVDDLEAVIRAHSPTDGALTLEFLRPSGTENTLTVDVLARLPADRLKTVAFQPDPDSRVSQSR
jgi:S1-C subfamily serine protease